MGDVQAYKVRVGVVPRLILWVVTITVFLSESDREQYQNAAVNVNDARYVLPPILGDYLLRRSIRSCCCMLVTVLLDKRVAFSCNAW